MSRYGGTAVIHGNVMLKGLHRQMTHKVAISRGPESTLPAARKHFEVHVECCQPQGQYFSLTKP